MSCTASKVPEQRSWLSTSLGLIVCGCSCRLGLRQRTKCTYVLFRSTMSESRSFMKRRATELKALAFRLAPPAPALGSAGLNIAAMRPLPLALRALSKSVCSVSLFLSRKCAAM